MVPLPEVRYLWYPCGSFGGFCGKAFVMTCFWAKVCLSSCASTKGYSRLGGTSSSMGGPKIPPPPRALVTSMRSKINFATTLNSKTEN